MLPQFLAHHFAVWLFAKTLDDFIDSYNKMAYIFFLAVDTQNWHDEGFLDNLGRTGQTSPFNQSDRPRQVCQIANWTAPLSRSRRDDRNAYIERIIRSPDEGVMTPRRPAPRSDRSDRSRAVRPVQRPVGPVRNAQSELGVVF